MSQTRTDRSADAVRKLYLRATLAVEMLAMTTYHEFLADAQQILAITRALDDIGRHAYTLRRTHVAAELRSLPWDELASMRYLLNHSYSAIPPEMLWPTVKHDLPSIIKILAEYLGCVCKL